MARKENIVQTSSWWIKKKTVRLNSFQNHYLGDHLHNTWSSHCQIRGLSAIQDVLGSSHP